MANFELRITGSTDNPDDLNIFGLLAGGAVVGQPIPAGPGPAPADASGDTAAATPKRGTKSGKAADKGAVHDETAASPATEPPTPKVQQTAEQQKAVDPAVEAAQNGGNTGAPGSTKHQTEAVAEPEAAVDQVGETAPAPAATAPGDVTLDSLKALLTAAMAHNAAKTLQDVIRATAGVPGLSQAEAADYPKLYEALLPYSKGEVKA